MNNILASLNAVTRRALRIDYRSPMICELEEEASGTGTSTVDTIGIVPTFRVAGPTLSINLNGADVELDWTTVEGAFAYIVYRATAEEGPYSPVVSGLLASDYVDNPGSGTFFYKVTAIEPNFGESEASNVVSVTV